MDMISELWAQKEQRPTSDITPVGKDDISTSIAKWLGASREDHARLVADPSARSLDLAVSKVILRTQQDGDVARLIALLSHLRDSNGNALAGIDAETLRALAKMT